MNKKFIFLIILIIILLAVAGYFILLSKTTPPPVQTKNSVEYVNNQYGFSVSLPQDWQGYSVVTDTWNGDVISKNGQVQTSAIHGPMISIRNPLWTQTKPYQDIPIMVFTTQQWTDMSREKFHVGAAPINPSQLGFNDSYVFALPARYNFAFLQGWQEVDQIIQSKPLRTFAPAANDSGTIRIDSVVPTSGAVGLDVTITGSGFMVENTVLLDNLVAIKNAHVDSSADGHQTILFIVPSALTADCKQRQMCPMFARQVTPAIYSLSVENQNGLSNSVAFTVTQSQTNIQHCGGNTVNPPQCPSGYHCAPDPNSHLPFGDVGGICIHN